MSLQLKVIVEGPIQGSFILKAPIAHALFIGRSSECQVAIADPLLSRQHFSISWDGDQSLLTHLSTTNATIVNGSLVNKVVLQQGDVIIAGDTHFKIIIENSGTSQPKQKESQENSSNKYASYERLQPLAIFEHIAITQKVLENTLTKPLKKGSLLEQLLKVVEKDKASHWYAIIDAAKAASLAYQAKAMGYPVYTLFMGDTAQDFDLASVGPCVIHLDKPLPFLELWVTYMGENIGVLLQTEAELDIIFAHLRNIFVARDELGDDYFFRYYDPIILKGYLSSCTKIELNNFFSVVKAWVYEEKKLKKYKLTQCK